jgi:plastocyanin domain-containing protein
LVSVVSSRETTNFIFDFAYFDNVQGQYAIVDGSTGEAIAVFNGERGINEVEFKPVESEIYGIVKGSTLLGIITTADDVDDADLEAIRRNFIAE